MHPLTDISVTIPHLRGRRHLLACLQALHPSHLPDPVPEIVLVDDGSTDGSTQEAAATFPGVRVIHSEHNLGYAGACNLGLAAVTGRWTVFLNDDAIVASGTLTAISSRLARDEDPDRLLLQPTIRRSDEPWRFDYAGGAGGLIDRWGYPFALGRLFDLLESDDGQYGTAGPLAWTSGCCMAGSTRRFRALGGFEAAYFAHFEEIDLCWRHRRDGGRIESLPQAVVYHMGPSTLPTGARKTYLNFRNSLWTVRRNTPPATRIMVLVVRFLLDCSAAVRMLLTGDPAGAGALARGWWAGIAQRPWAGVHPPPSKRSSADRAGTYRGSAAVARYLRGVRSAADLLGRTEGWQNLTDG